jgi:hypothetical protein
MAQEQFGGRIFPGAGTPVLPIEGDKFFVRKVFPLAGLG